MIEYIVVLAFSVILLIRPIPPAADDPYTPIEAGANDSAITLLAQAIKDYHKHYTYAMAIAYIPDCDYETTVADINTGLAANVSPYASLQSKVSAKTSALADADKSGVLDMIMQSIGAISVSGDRCPDVQNFSGTDLIPALDFSSLKSLLPTTFDDFASIICGMISKNTGVTLTWPPDPTQMFDSLVDKLNPF